MSKTIQKEKTTKKEEAIQKEKTIVGIVWLQPYATSYCIGKNEKNIRPLGLSVYGYCEESD